MKTLLIVITMLICRLSPEYRTSQSILYNYRIPKSVVNKAVQSAYKYGEMYGIPPKVILAIAIKESRLDSTAEDGGCIGIAQMNKAAAKYDTLNFGRLNEIDYAIFAISKRLNTIINIEGCKSTPRFIAMYKAHSLRNKPVKMLIQMRCYTEFMKHYQKLR